MDFLIKYAPQIQGLVRIVIGLFLFLEHGTAKMFGFPMAAGASPHAFNLMAFPVGPAGVIGSGCRSFLIVIGLFKSCWAAFIASGEMAFAYFMAHFPRSPLAAEPWWRRGGLLLFHLPAAGRDGPGRLRRQQQVAIVPNVRPGLCAGPTLCKRGAP